MTEHDAGREDREDREGHEGPEPRAPETGAGQDVPLDEDAAWRAIVAGYGDEPPDPPGAKPFKSVEDLALLESGANDADDTRDDGVQTQAPAPARADEEPAGPLGGSVSFAPGVGPRDYTVPEPSDDDLDESDEGHFVPPEPPPLPETDPAVKLAWLGVLGGPLLLLLAVLLDWYMSWWLTTLSIGGFLGGCATLVMRMRTDDEDDDDPGRGAVV
ncbi:hypothetical protein [Streptomyces sp. bgisy022]|uniref:hypothetical protein n=1 Tax=Streptomyces sp. bgisy022 TaxID=3413769 RepID=UPI003D755E18